MLTSKKKPRGWLFTPRLLLSPAARLSGGRRRCRGAGDNEDYKQLASSLGHRHSSWSQM
jgi:hypothetical protein